MTVPISGTVGAEGDSNATPLTGTFAIQRFAQSGSAIVAVGTLSVTPGDAAADAPPAGDAAAAATRTIVTQISLPLSREAVQPGTAPAPAPGSAVTPQQQTGCEGLRFLLGPSEMTVLELNVQLDRIVLDVVGAAGGSPRGSDRAAAVDALVCSITSRLQGTGQGQASSLVDLLNQLLDRLG